MLVTGTALTIAYYLVNTTSAGSIAELAGVGFVFFFLGTLTVLGEAIGVAPSDDK